MIVVPGWVPSRLIRVMVGARARTGKPLLEIRVGGSSSSGQPRRLDGEKIENMKPLKINQRNMESDGCPEKRLWPLEE
jgi:hypothetical protein